MVDREDHKSFAERLIEQDSGISESSMTEQSMKTHQTLTALDDKARASQRLTVRAIAAVVGCYICGFVLNGAQAWLPAYGEALLIVWTICTWVALITAAIVVTRYWTVHRPQLERGRIDLQVAMFQELQQQIAELRGAK